MRREIERMRPGNPIRQASEVVLETGVLPAEFVEPMLSRLKTFRPWLGRTQRYAMWLLCCAQVEGQEKHRICARLREIVGRWPLLGTKQRMLRAAGWALALSGSFVFTLIRLDPYPDYMSMLLVLLVIGGVSWFAIMPVLAGVDHHKMTNLREQALIALARLPTVESLAVAAEAYREGSAIWQRILYGNMSFYRTQTLRGKAAWALLNILPCVRKSDYGCLPSSTVPNLCWIVAWTGKADDVSNKALSLQILRALNNIGDARAIPAVEQLAKSSPSEVVRQTAARTLSILQERHRQESATQTLLRASGTGVSTPDALLRAADAVPTKMDAGEMLRAEYPVDAT